MNQRFRGTKRQVPGAVLLLAGIAYGTPIDSADGNASIGGYLTARSHVLINLLEPVDHVLDRDFGTLSTLAVLRNSTAAVTSSLMPEQIPQVNLHIRGVSEEWYDEHQFWNFSEVGTFSQFAYTLALEVPEDGRDYFLRWRLEVAGEMNGGDHSDAFFSYALATDCSSAYEAPHLPVTGAVDGALCLTPGRPVVYMTGALSGAASVAAGMTTLPDFFLLWILV